MGCLRFLCRSTAFLVAVLAIVVGLVFTGVPHQVGVYKYLDSYKDSEGNSRFSGLLPAFHKGIPFGFDIKKVAAGSLKDQTFVVTGANVGLGYWTTYHLVSKGGDVVMACRSNNRCEAAKKEILDSLKGQTSLGKLECEELDLGSLSSVSSFAKAFTKSHNKLHSLILNAGVMMTPHTLTVDGIEKQIGTNHFGHFYLTQLLIDSLASTATSSSPTTISVVSSSAHFDTYPEGIKLSLAALNDPETYHPVKAYGQSKLANVLFTQELAERIKDKNVLANVIHPGVVATDLARYVKENWLKWLPASFVEAFLDFIKENMMWSGEIAAYTQLYAAISDEVKAKKITGKYFHPIAREARPHARHAFNSTLQKQFWKVTEEVLKDKIK